jgi:hypothetical protein
MSISQPTVAALQRVNDGQGLLLLLSIEHPALSGPVRVVSDTRSVESGGITYTPLPFAIMLPNDKSKEVPRARIQIDNVGREITGELERLPPGAALLATIRIVYRATPNYVDYEFTSPLSGIRVDQLTVTAAMGPDDIMRRPATLLRFDPVTTPALFPG